MTAHGEALRVESQDDQLVDGVKQDYTRLDLSPGERAMLDYTVKLTVAPWSVGEEDIQTLRARGFDDRDILDIVYVICLYNFNDRMADAMGIKAMIFCMAEAMYVYRGRELAYYGHGSKIRSWLCIKR
jgi:uncharacterized peroxidase-related enzyme